MIGAAPQILKNPCCDFINSIPWWVFLLIHIALFVIGAVLALRMFGAGERQFGWGFALFAIAELSYMTYHVNITQFLFAHTISEVLDGLAFIILFTAATQKGIAAARSGGTREPSMAAR